jgi:GDP-4-dehydro-6-deoxy-D-mannose reductase
MQTALITGAKGFCAHHLARALVANGVSVIGLDREPGVPRDTLLQEYLVLDMNNSESLSVVFRQRHIDRVFHLAGKASGCPGEMYRANADNTFNLLEVLHRYAPHARVLLVGSAAEYGPVMEAEMPVTEEHPCRPVVTYGISKYAATLAGLDYARNHGMRIVVARPFNIVGSGISTGLLVGAVLKRIKAALAGDGEASISVGNLDTRRDFIAVEDVVSAYIRMLDGEYWGQVFNICSGEPRTIRSVVERLLSFAPRTICAEVDPAFVRTSDVASIYGSWKKAAVTFGFKPSTSLESALQAAWKHVMETKYHLQLCREDT